MSEDTIPPAGLHPLLVKKLLDGLESDDGFRALFQQSPEQALRSLGYVDPWACMTLKGGATLASPEQIRAQRAKLEEAATGVQQYFCVFEAQEGY